MNKELAPIVLFAFNRPEHTRITLEHLSRSRLADRSKLFIYCDGPKSGSTAAQRDKIAAVRRVAESQAWTREVVVRKNEVNRGLAKSVLRGVTEVVQEHGRVIVLEDDLKIGQGFLQYMNEGLERYADEDRVKQISGYRFPFKRRDSARAFFMPLTNTIGWGTWERAWREVDFTAAGYQVLKKDQAMMKRFNLDGAYNYGRILIGQLEKHLNDSWGILLWWSIFKRNGLVLYPGYSFIQHDDFDSSGVHRSDFAHYDQPGWSDHYREASFPSRVEVDDASFDAMKAYIHRHTKPSPRKVARKLMGRIWRP